MSERRVPDDLAAVVTVPALLSVATVWLTASWERTSRGDRTVIRADDLRGYIDSLELLGIWEGARSHRMTAGRCL